MVLLNFFEFTLFFILFFIILRDFLKNKKPFKIHILTFIFLYGIKSLIKGIAFIFPGKVIAIIPTILLGCSFLILQTYFLEKIKTEMLLKKESPITKQKQFNLLSRVSRIFIGLTLMITIFSIPFYTNTWSYLNLHEFVSVLLLTLMIPNIIFFGFFLKRKIITILLTFYTFIKFINMIILVIIINFHQFYHFDLIFGRIYLFYLNLSDIYLL